MIGTAVFLLYSKLIWSLNHQNLEAWEEAKKEVEKIPEHPNQMTPQEPTAGGTGSSNARRDSTTTVNGR
jgi:sorting nexin-41/42